MKKTPSILFIAVFLLAGSRASGQMVDSCKCDCGTLYPWAYFLSGDPSDEPQGYDTDKMFLEDCAFFVDTPSFSWDVFVDAGAAVSAWSAGGAGRWPDFLTLLKQVLYNNPDTNWYCNDVVEMFSADRNVTASEAIGTYMLQSGKCPEFNSFFQSQIIADKNYLHTTWKDSVVRHFGYIDSPANPVRLEWMNDSINADTLAHPFDTTVPTLFQDTLEVLLGPQYAESVQPSSPITSEALLSAQLLENPLQDEINISYQVGRTALVTMELRDVLGRSVPIANAKYQLEQPGDHNATLPAPNLPPGTYYLRITTDAGDAITLKIVKE